MNNFKIKKEIFEIIYFILFIYSIYLSSIKIEISTILSIGLISYSIIKLENIFYDDIRKYIESSKTLIIINLIIIILKYSLPFIGSFSLSSVYYSLLFENPMVIGNYINIIILNVFLILTINNIFNKLKKL